MLRQVMVRTERLAASADRDGMLRLVPDRHVQLTAADISSYLTVQQVARTLGQPDVLEYWKSAPYLLNFMERAYKLKQEFDQAHQSPETGQVLEHLLRSREGLLPRLISRPIGRLTQEMRACATSSPTPSRRGPGVGCGLPHRCRTTPSVDHIPDEEAATFTKRLIFSSWRVAPKAIATLTSYEVERRMLTSFEPDAVNTPEARQKRRPLLRFARDDKGWPAGMTVLGLLYPSQTLAELGDPLKYAVSRQPSETPISISEVLDWASAKIERALTAAHLPDPQERRRGSAVVLGGAHPAGQAPLPGIHRSGGGNNWTWPPGGRWVLRNPDTAEEDSNWAAHIQEAQALLADRAAPFGRRPADLPLVLAELALAGPGVAALRALARVCGVSIARVDEPVRNGAAQISWGFRSLFNTPEVMALVRGLAFDELGSLPATRRRRDSHVVPATQRRGSSHTGARCWSIAWWVVSRPSWTNTPTCSGNPLAFWPTNAERTALKIAQAVNEALTLRTSALRVDDVRIDRLRQSIDVTHDWAIRTHFAVRFGDETSEDGRQVTRKEQVLRRLQLAVLALRAGDYGCGPGRTGLPLLFARGRPLEPAC